MSFNGSGTFQINSAGQPVVTGTTVSSTSFNALTADLATGLSNALCKDGQTTATAQIPFAAGLWTIDSAFLIKDNGDLTKIAKFECSGITTGTTRTYTLPDASMTFARSDAAQTFTGTQTFSAAVNTDPTIVLSGSGAFNSRINFNGSSVGGVLNVLSGGNLLVQIATTTVTTTSASGFTLASGADLQLGRAYSAGATTATGTIAIKDSTGTTYNVLVHT